MVTDRDSTFLDNLGNGSNCYEMDKDLECIEDVLAYDREKQLIKVEEALL